MAYPLAGCVRRTPVSSQPGRKLKRRPQSRLQSSGRGQTLSRWNDLATIPSRTPWRRNYRRRNETSPIYQPDPFKTESQQSAPSGFASATGELLISTCWTWASPLPAGSPRRPMFPAAITTVVTVFGFTSMGVTWAVSRTCFRKVENGRRSDIKHRPRDCIGLDMRAALDHPIRRHGLNRSHRCRVAYHEPTSPLPQALLSGWLRAAPANAQPINDPAPSRAIMPLEHEQANGRI